MKLIVFHQLLIASAVIFCLGFGGYELYLGAFRGGTTSTGATVTGINNGALPQGLMMTAGETSASGLYSLLTGLAMITGAVVLSFYLRWLYRRYAGQMAGF